MRKHRSIMVGSVTLTLLAASLAAAPQLAAADTASASAVALSGGSDAGENDVESSSDKPTERKVVAEVTSSPQIRVPMGGVPDLAAIGDTKVDVVYTDGTTGTATPVWNTSVLEDAGKFAKPGTIQVVGTLDSGWSESTDGGLTPNIFDTFMTVVVYPTSSYFVDLPANHWAVTQGWIDTALEDGLMGGYQNKFAPDATLTRGQVAAILYRIMNPESDATTNPDHYGKDTGFADGGEQRYYYAAVKWMKEQNISTGDKDAAGNSLNRFRPDDPITRQELVALIYRAAAVHSKEWAAQKPAASVLDQFKDRGSIDGYAVEPLAWAYGQTIITGGQGDAAGLIGPRDNATRAQAAKIMSVFYTNGFIGMG